MTLTGLREEPISSSFKNSWTSKSMDSYDVVSYTKSFVCNKNIYNITC